MPNKLFGDNILDKFRGLTILKIPQESRFDHFAGKREFNFAFLSKNHENKFPRKLVSLTYFGEILKNLKFFDFWPHFGIILVFTSKLEYPLEIQGNMLWPWNWTIYCPEDMVKISAPSRKLNLRSHGAQPPPIPVTGSENAILACAWNKPQFLHGHGDRLFYNIAG